MDILLLISNGNFVADLSNDYFLKHEFFKIFFPSIELFLIICGYFKNYR